MDIARPDIAAPDNRGGRRSHANLPAFGGIFPLSKRFPAVPRGIHDIPLLLSSVNFCTEVKN